MATLQRPHVDAKDAERQNTGPALREAKEERTAWATVFGTPNGMLGGGSRSTEEAVTSTVRQEQEQLQEHTGCGLGLGGEKQASRRVILSTETTGQQARVPPPGPGRDPRAVINKQLKRPRNWASPRTVETRAGIFPTMTERHSIPSLG